MKKVMLLAARPGVGVERREDGLVPGPARRGERDGGLEVDLAHGNAEVRSRFRRPGPLAFDALAFRSGDHPSIGTPGVTFEITHSFEVDEHVGWCRESTAAVDPRGVVKQISFLHASSGVHLPEFREHYRAHVEVARRHMPTLCQYVQNDVVSFTGSQSAGSHGIVAISELWFATTDDFLHHYFASPEDEAAFRSHEGFLDLSKAFSFIAAEFHTPA